MPGECRGAQRQTGAQAHVHTAEIWHSSSRLGTGTCPVLQHLYILLVFLHKVLSVQL